MKRPLFLTIWLIVLLLLSIAMTVDSLTYLSFIFLTKSYVSLLGIAAGFVQVWAVIQLFRWKKIGIKLLISSMIVIFLVTGINELNLIPKVSDVIFSLIIILLVNLAMLGILYLAIRPVWKNFK